MPSVTIDDVLASAKSIWDADTEVASLVPGGLWHGRAEEGAVYPHAVITCEAGDRQEFSGVAYLQPFTVTIQIRDSANSPTTGIIAARLSTLFDRKTAAIGGSGNRVVHIRPKPPRLNPEDRTKAANVVLLAVSAWEFLIQANRS